MYWRDEVMRGIFWILVGIVASRWYGEQKAAFDPDDEQPSEEQSGYSRHAVLA
jgi:hypothetical protein